MVDFKERNRFAKPSPEKESYYQIANSIRHTFDDELNDLFLNKSLNRRIEAYQNIKNIKAKYSHLLKTVAPEEKKALEEAIDRDERIIEQALRKKDIRVFLTIQGINIPFLSEKTESPFTLYDFFEHPYLNGENIFFFAHFPQFEPQLLADYLPGMNDHGLDEESKKETPFKHIVFKTSNVAYDIIVKSKKGCDIYGRGPIEKFSRFVQFEIPQLDLPGGIHEVFDQIIGGKNGKSRKG